MTRRIFVAALLIILTPSLVLAGMPVRYCVGPTSHRALEFVVEGIVHGGSHDSHEDYGRKHADDGNASDRALIADQESCDDRALMDTASVPPSIDFTQLPLTAFLASAAVPVNSSMLSTGSHVSSFPTFAHRVFDPCMRVRRTVVLLI